MRRLCTALIGLLFLFAGSAFAAEETAFRYWSFWTSENGKWVAAATGVAAIPATDGAVQGWRFVTAAVALSDNEAPRESAAFEDICAGVEPATGKARVGVVIDYGTSADYDGSLNPPAVRTECVLVTDGDPMSFALSASAEVRENAGFVCALDSLPETGCGEEVPLLSAPSESTSTPDESTSTSDEEADNFASIVTTVLAFIMFGFAWRSMLIQKRKKQARKDSDD